MSSYSCMHEFAPYHRMGTCQKLEQSVIKIRSGYNITITETYCTHVFLSIGLIG